MGVNNEIKIVTQKDFDALNKLLSDINIKIEENRKAIQFAISLGDLSENAEYHSSKELQGELNGKKELILNELSISKVGDFSKEETILNGATVVAKNLKTGKNVTYCFCSSSLISDLDNLIVPMNTPIGEAFKGHKVNDVISFRDNKFKIISIKY